MYQQNYQNMGFKQLLTLVPLAMMVHAQEDATTTDAVVTTTTEDATATTDATTATNETLFIDEPPIYSDEECDSWLDILVESDADSSKGLSESEYHSFLTSIEEPPYIAEYFSDIPSFNRLPWTFRVVHKSLACHCQKLGMGEACCEGDNAEVLLLGMDDNPIMVPVVIATANGNSTDDSNSTNSTTTTDSTIMVRNEAAEEEYKDLFCQQIAYVLTKQIPSPAPTASPTESPTKSPSFSPSAGPTKAPTEAPSVSPSANPTPSPITPPTSSPTSSPTVNVTEVIPELQVRNVAPPPEEDDGLGTGGIIGIILAVLVLIAALIALMAYKRKLERDRLRKLAESSPEADLEAQTDVAEMAEPAAEPEPANEPEPEAEPDEDDESSAPSVWSESDDADEGTNEMMDTGGEDDKVTAGSALAAMGAASTVAANLMSPGAKG